MQTPNERIAELEREVAELRKDVEIAARLPIDILDAVLTMLVDQRRIPADLRKDAWRAADGALGPLSAASPRVRSAARNAITALRGDHR